MHRTVRLYFDDPGILEFEARVVAHGAWKGSPTVVLDRTAFYPEGGGQLGDRGQLGDDAVSDVQEDEDGNVHHLFSGAAPAVGDVVRGRVDGGRRRSHRALHTAQHVLSRALLDLADAETASARLGETACTIDLTRSVDERTVARAEDLSNAIVDDDVPVRAFFPEVAELAALPLRRAPKVTDDVRVVVIGEFDVTPCGGTHCARTAQIGFVRVWGVERYKGGTRVTFDAGPRARVALAGESTVLRTIGRDFTCAPGDVPGAIERLRRDLQDARETLGQTRAKLADAVADGLVAGDDPIVVAAVDGAPIETLRAIATRICAEEGRVAILAGPAPDGAPLVVARGPKSDFDCGAFVKRIAAAAGGRGGGRPERAEGRIPAGVDFDKLARSVLTAK